MVLISDKEGGFVVLPEGLLQKKAIEAVRNNFKTVHFCPKKLENAALNILQANETGCSQHNHCKSRQRVKPFIFLL